MASVLLLSGGMDSLVAAYASRREHQPALALTFDYGQRAARRELAAALAVSADLGITHRYIKLPWLARLTPPSLTDPGADLGAQTDDSVWVPARNAVFLSIAASFAEALGCEAIVCGFNAEEGASFPDNTPEFVNRVNAVLELATRNAPRVISPTISLTKPEILRLGVKVGAPLRFIWSCYGPGPEHCWRCPSCLRLRAALQETGLWASFAEPQGPDEGQNSRERC